MSRLRHVSVNQVEVSDAPASSSTRISFSIPRIESANLWMEQRWRDISLRKTQTSEQSLMDLREGKKQKWSESKQLCRKRQASFINR